MADCLAKNFVGQSQSLITKNLQNWPIIKEVLGKFKKNDYFITDDRSPELEEFDLALEIITQWLSIIIGAAMVVCFDVENFSYKQ